MHHYLFRQDSRTNIFLRIGLKLMTILQYSLKVSQLSRMMFDVDLLSWCPDNLLPPLRVWCYPSCVHAISAMIPAPAPALGRRVVVSSALISERGQHSDTGTWGARIHNTSWEITREKLINHRYHVNMLSVKLNESTDDVCFVSWPNSEVITTRNTMCSWMSCGRWEWEVSVTPTINSS